MGDQISIQGAPLVISPSNGDTTPVHPPKESFGPGTATNGGSGDGDRNAGTPDFGGPENLAQRG